MTALPWWVRRLVRGVVLAVRAAGPVVWRLLAACAGLHLSGWLAGAVPTRVSFDVLPLGPWDTSRVAVLAGQLHVLGNVAGAVAAGALAAALVVSVRYPNQVVAWFCRRWVRADFAYVARASGLSREVGSGKAKSWVDPELLAVTSHGGVIIARIRARRGQSSSEIVAAAEKFAADFGAAAFRASVVSPSVASIRFTMLDALAATRRATLPEDRDLGTPLEPVEVGREDSGEPWRLSLVGKHTLVAGRSGSGKGSVLWGAVAPLGPWIVQDTVRVHGVDLKRGVEIAMGDGLMYRTAYQPEQAVEVLRDLLRIIDERAATMVGRSRLHQPRPGDPLHVLVIDELAALTAYAEAGVKKEGNRLLAEILTQGRAMGVVVVAFVQDPKKETVPMRGLFTQTVALRLQSAEEVGMVLGTGMTEEAPAHRIPDDLRGAGYLVTEEGTVARVRAHFWPDSLIKATAARFPAAKRWMPPLEETETEHHVISLEGVRDVAK